MDSIRAVEEPVRVGPRELPGVLWRPVGPGATVLFAHGSGSSRLSPRNHRVAQQLLERGLGTLRFDLLDETEAGDRARVFDIALLAERLVEALDWLDARDLAAGVDAPACGLFGASTGAAAALAAAAARPRRVGAVVCRGGRPDLAARWLDAVRAPTLLIVGERDTEVLRLNRLALAGLQCEAQLAVVPAASHLFEEPGALETVAEQAADWFAARLVCAPG